MRVTRHAVLVAALDFTFQLAEAAHELTVELALADECLRLSGERRPGSGQFCGELINLGLLRACDTCLGVFNPFLDLLKVTEDSARAHLVKSKDVVAINDHASQYSQEN